jgi:cob(I)alamin adenosyltransferase
MKIYTRTGDTGETSLLGGGRVPKDHRRVVAYGEVDELNAALGLAMAVEPKDFEAGLLERIQRELFAIGGQLASPQPQKVAKALERAETELQPLAAFIVPGGSIKGALLHVARTACRRAERGVVHLDGEEPVPPVILRYLNRLSDLLFALARLANHRAQVPEKTW